MGQVKTIFWDIGCILLTNGWDKTQRGLVTANKFFRKAAFLSDQLSRDCIYDDLRSQVCAECKIFHLGCFGIPTA